MRIKEDAEGRAFDWLYLALAYAERGDPQAAQTWLEKADQWINKQPNDHAALRQLRHMVVQKIGE